MDEKRYFWTCLVVTIVLVLVLIFKSSVPSLIGAFLSGLFLLLAGLFKWMAEDSGDPQNTSDYFRFLGNILITISLTFALCAVWVWFILILLSIAFFMAIKSAA